MAHGGNNFSRRIPSSFVSSVVTVHLCVCAGAINTVVRNTFIHASNTRGERQLFVKFNDTKLALTPLTSDLVMTRWYLMVNLPHIMIFTKAYKCSWVHLDRNTEDFESVLRRYPWQKPSSLEYPVCPVRNQFNKDIQCNTGPPAFGNNSDVPCHSTHDGETASPGIGDNIVHDKKNRTSDISAICPSIQLDATRNSHIDSETSTANNGGISEYDERTCVAQPNCDTKSITFEGNKLPSHSDQSIEKQDISPCSIKVIEHDSARFPENLDGTCYSLKLSPQNDDAARTLDPDDKIDQRPGMGVVEGRISQEVVEQFAKVLMEAVRRRVFNLPRKATLESCRPTAVLEENGSEVIAGEKKANCNIGILFSGGLDSIVLAALADK